MLKKRVSSHGVMWVKNRVALASGKDNFPLLNTMFYAPLLVVNGNLSLLAICFFQFVPGDKQKHRVVSRDIYIYIYI